MNAIKDMNNRIKSCLQDENPFCTHTCPFHLNVKEFVQKLKRGSIDSAYKTYRNAVGFPQIVAEICDYPCQSTCPRKDIDGAVQMNKLEQAVCNLTKNKKPTDYNIPSKNFSIAVVGGGITGLACTLRLAEKKYNVTLFEKTDKLGGSLKKLMNPEIMQEEIDNQFMFIDFNLRLNHEINSLAELSDFDAVYIATGKGGNSFDLLNHTLPGHFIGGSILGCTKMEALAMGLDSVNSVEWWLKTKNMPPNKEYSSCKMQIDNEVFIPTPIILPANGSSYTKEEVICEAKRCVECSCDGCRRHCDLIDIYKKLPKRFKEEVDNSIEPKHVDGGGYTYKRLMAACSNCGQCKEHCPQDIDFGSFILEGRAKIQEKGQMPPAFYGYWLDDCEHAMSSQSIVAVKPQGCSKAEIAFFPGCQLGASDPNYVLKVYDFLKSKEANTAMMLNCCGVPQLWAGKKELHNESLKKLREQWNYLGQPKLIFTCPTCYEQFKRFLPEIKGQMLYEMPELQAFAENKAKEQTVSKQKISVFDPCVTRTNPELQKAVRKLAAALNYQDEPLKTANENAMCCSWGGHGSIANPDFAKKVTKRRIEQNENKYIAYCINCRDTFAKAGKPVYHILDLLFDINDSLRKPPLISERRKNRELLAAELKQIFGQNSNEVSEMKIENKYNLKISESLKSELSENYILEDNIMEVINHCEDTKESVLSKTSNHYFGHLQIGYATYWVEYEKNPDNITLINAYSHRMQIDD
ncbi:MAG: pyridine nucleotide-disulfide oxidoreductase/dicluster-binding protein [Bacillota bacterium]|jgi:Fe-S oxidoreductase